MHELITPIDQYRPEVLVLAPTSGEDANVESLVAQLLDLGVAFELDADWRLPTSPPRDLSAYKVCLFPDTAQATYDAELNAFHRGGGFLPYYKYYPTESGGAVAGVHHHFQSFGRDAYFYHLANVALEGGLTVRHPEFAATLAARATSTIAAELRGRFMAQYIDREIDVWRSWGDPQYTMLYAYLIMADTTADSELLAGVRRCLQKLVESKHVPLTRANSENQLENTVDTNVVLFAALLMHAGTRFGEPEMVAAGCELGQFWTAAAELRDGIYYARYMRYLWGESFAMAPCLYWLTRVTGEPHYARAADAVIERTLSRNQRATGIFDHWSDDAGGRGASWSRGNCWPVLWLTQALYAVDPASAAAERIRAALQRTFNGLAAYQNRERGLWHLVVDEAETRLEVSATVGIVYCLDRLRELGVIGAEFDAMAGSAFSGLKRMYYAAGLAGNCRGTSTGVPEYYRTRPIGYHRNSLFPGVVGPRL